jgi:hypothetical protein
MAGETSISDQSNQDLEKVQLGTMDVKTFEIEFK